MKDVVFEICEQMLRNSPGRSYKRLNPALRSTLDNCIAADLPFQRDTFKKIYNELRGGWWFGDGSGSAMGEHYYASACEVNHASAQQSFEHFAERPAVLWGENVGVPSRLHVGSKFTWKGYYVTVTSMRKDSLVACTYKKDRNDPRGIKVGAVVCYDPCYVVVSSKRHPKSSVVTLDVIESASSGYDSEIARRFIVPYADIVEYRRKAKARVKELIAKISSCNPDKDREAITSEINEIKFRHFELEQIQAAFLARENWISNEGAVAAWRKGESGRWLDVKGTFLRVNGDLVECSNGNSVSRPAAARALPILLANRHKTMRLDMPVGGYHVSSVGPMGVKIGCTLIPWLEIEIIAPALK